jgi:mannose-1-phosphate guanylyltransferase
MPSTLRRYAVIMAGGAGTRFWPRSRRLLPKQLLPIVSERSMLAETFARACTLVPRERILVVTAAPLARAVRRQIPALPARNLVAEPVGRNTAACIGVAALRIAHEADDAVMLVLPADHMVTNGPRFRRAVRLAGDLAEGGALVTVGIVPTRPETGYGYIEWGRRIPGTRGAAAWAASFTEKPDLRRARRFVAGGRYLWNSGMFAWRARGILEQIDAHLPALGRQLGRLAPALGTRRARRALSRVYPAMPSVSIDRGVLEHARRVAVVRGRFGWSDIGSWAAMEDLWRERRRDGNTVRGRAVSVGARGCVVFAPERLVALCGVEDLVVVDAPDAVLVCHKDRVQDVRLVVREVERQGLRNLL